MMTLQTNDRINLKAWFAFTVTPYNVFHMPEFMKWKLVESGLTKFNPLTGMRPVITHHMCHSPKYFNVKVLPPYLKDQVKQYYQEHKDWVMTTEFEDKVKNNFVKVLNGVEKFMMSEDYSTEWLTHFIDQTKRLDEVRGQNILDIVPQYKDLFDDKA